MANGLRCGNLSDLGRQAGDFPGSGAFVQDAFGGGLIIGLHGFNHCILCRIDVLGLYGLLDFLGEGLERGFYGFIAKVFLFSLFLPFYR